jgi:hypothetical protein
MTSFKYVFAAVAAAAVIGLTPTAHAQVACLNGINSGSCNVHVVAAGSSAQYLPAAIGADTLAGYKLANPSGGFSNSPVYATSTQCVYHWSAKSNGNLVDNRGTVAIPLEPGNEWVVWIASLDSGTTCPSAGGTSTGNNGITDVWAGISVDSTVGNRAFLAQNTAANGGSGVALETIPVAAGNLLGTGSGNLWPDNASDVSVLTGGATNLPKALGTDQAGIVDVHINTGLTDIRPEDAYYATTRAMAKFSATLSGLGYNSTTDVGQSILTSEGTGTKATPVKFAVTGSDPITKIAIRGYTTFPIGAAPIVFIYNNAGAAYPTNLVTGVLGDGKADTAGSYLLANLFDGTTSCDTSNPAFGSTGVGSTALHLFLREPLSGTMNTTEFNLFRTIGNTSDSQEKGISLASGTINPAAQVACNGSGDRSRAIGTGEVIGTSSTGVLGTANGMGYVFTGFANFAKFKGSANYTYFTLDGVDPFGFAPSEASAGQVLPNCGGPCAAATFWTGGRSFPNLRNGSYKAWSLYRWLVPSPDTDAYGPTVLAQETEDHIDDSIAVADFVPFEACPTSDPTCSNANTVPTDGLAVYREHHVVSGTGTTANNGSVTAANALDGGNTLGGGTEGGGDVGGLIQGPYGTAEYAGYVETVSACTSKKGYKVSYKAADEFESGTAWEGATITIGGVAYTVSNVAVTTGASGALYVGGSTTSTTCSGPTPPNDVVAFYSITVSGHSAPAAKTPGTLNGKE